MKSNLNLFTSKVVGYIGKINPKIIQEIINISNEEKYIFHGIKNDISFEKINEEGILPLTPEGGNASYWNSGKAIFGNDSTSNFFTYNTAFFHYALSSSILKNTRKFIMNLAISKYTDLQSILDEEDCFEKDGHLTIHTPIPRNLINLIRLETFCKDSEKNLRKYSQILEREMVYQIYNLIKNKLNYFDKPIIIRK